MDLRQSPSVGARCWLWLQQLPGVRSLLEYLFDLSELPVSTDYKVWQRRFLHARLGLSLRLGFWVLLTFTARALYNLVIPLREVQQTVPPEVQRLSLLINAVMFVVLGGWFLLYRSRFGEQHPGRIFLWISLSVMLLPQILATFWELPYADVYGWSLIFLLQATIIPVRWEVHLLSQLGLFAYYYGVNYVLGLTVLPTLPGAPARSIFESSSFLYLLWFCFICDLAVYLYERLQKAEFESRRQAQLFLHAVSHDLRNPVMGMTLVLKSLLKQGQELVPVPRPVLEQMMESSDRQLRLINSLLEVHRYDTHGLGLNQVPTSLYEVVEGAIADLKAQITSESVTLVNQISPNLPLVNIDATQIWRVFTNLIVNAMNHNRSGIEIVLNAQPLNGLVRCTVEDNGVGMTTTESIQMFELYTRGLHLKRRVGLGLGLYICRQIILAHGGDIGVTSTPNAGATFWFTLPLAPGAERLQG